MAADDEAKSAAAMILSLSTKGVNLYNDLISEFILHIWCNCITIAPFTNIVSLQS